MDNGKVSKCTVFRCEVYFNWELCLGMKETGTLGLGDLT